jgi:hypothetical protein
VAHRNQVAFADEQMGLTERDPALDELRRSRHDEQAISILFDLGPLVGLAGVLDGEIVQVELLLHVAEQRQIRLVQPDPDYVSRLAAPVRGFIDRDIGNTPAVDVGPRGNDALGRDRIGRGGSQRHNSHGFNPDLCC